MKLAQAIATVNTRIEVETFTATFDPPDHEELHRFLEAARVCAAHATPEPTLDLELAGAVKTLILCATRGITTGEDLKNAIITARRFLPHTPFDLNNYPELRDAIRTITMYATKTAADGTAMHYWPDRVTEGHSLHIASALNTALRTVAVHADIINNLNIGTANAGDVGALVADVTTRVDSMTTATGDDIRSWARATQVGLLVLTGCLPDYDALPVTAGQDATALDFRAVLFGNAEMAGQPTLRQAIDVVHALVSKELPNGQTIHWWPLRVDETQAVHIGQALDRVLAVIGQHLAALSAHGARLQIDVALADFLDKMRGRVVRMQVDASGDGRVAAADFVQSGLHVLLGMLPASDSPVVAELDAVPAFNAADHAGLPMAITTIHNLATKRAHDGQPIDWWPQHTTPQQATYVSGVLDIALAVIESHAEALTAAHHGPDSNARDAENVVHDLQARVTVMQAATPAELAVAADAVHSSVRMLDGLLPASDSPVVAELDTTKAAQAAR